MLKRPPAGVRDSGDPGSVPRLGRSPGGGKSTHSSMFTWKTSGTEESDTTIPGVTKSQT